ncbi:MAG: hypothetical protein HDS59_00090 [Barnesiella sp.]|nr:hypothetical protein [Barnesiella sp.]
MNTVIKISPATEDTRIGSVFGKVFMALFSTEQTNYSKVDKVIWDFSECSFLHPFYLAALGILADQFRDKILIDGVSERLKTYFHTVCFEKPLEIDYNHSYDIIGNHGTKTYIPICKFNPKEQKASDEVQKIVQDALKAQIGKHTALHQILSLSLGELVDNISDHSGADTAFIYSQYMANEGNIYLFIADRGRSIYTSFATDDRYSSQLTQLESSALRLALSGKSTKNRPENENRGYGISRTRRIIVDGLGGGFFILSGGTFFRHETASDDTIIDLPEDVRWDGTVILLKIPTNVPDGFNIYDYIE